MATLVELCNANQLVRLDPQLRPSVMEERFIYLHPRVQRWLADELPTAESSWNIEQSPLEQFDALQETFCSGEPLAIGHAFKHLLFRNEPGVWELKTADIRIFGWFPQKDHFIASGCNLTRIVKESGMYAGYATQLQRDRELLELNEPKYISGSEPDDVVSNFYFP